ncbi:hypothetical protein V3473_00005, partial [Pseudomonas aeruginosa]|nr:hypothetical protein [Pseudomonas aeruginosa]
QRRVTTCGGRRKTQPTVRDGLTTTNHALYDAETRQAVHVTLDIERGAGQVHVIVRMGSTLNSLGLPLDSQSNANTVADYIESIANGRLDTADETPARRRFDQAA